uniref:Dematin-like n=1 Tax=Sinocyclocheilus anshuiensis TaxID=1608454 RepID=A0A671QJ17_9TELE
DICLKRVKGVVRAGVARSFQHGLHSAAPQNQPRLQRLHAALPQAGYGFIAQRHSPESFRCVCNCTCIYLSDSGTNIYKKPPIYKHDGQTGTSHSKHDVIIESSKFPAAQPPDPNQPSKIETEYWPCPPSLASMEIEWRKKAAEQGKPIEDDEFEDLTEDAKRLQEQELQKIQSNLGKLILKEEIEKSVLIRRKTRSLPDGTNIHLGSSASATKSTSLPPCSQTGLTRLQSADFTSTDNEKAKTG